jgi:hypothetical protein
MIAFAPERAGGTDSQHCRSPLRITLGLDRQRWIAESRYTYVGIIHAGCGGWNLEVPARRRRAARGARRWNLEVPKLALGSTGSPGMPVAA